MPPLPTDFEQALDDEGMNVLRIRFRSSHGRIEWFVAQYEMIDGNARIPVVRFDTAHGRPHRDMMYLNGDRVKTWLDISLDYNETMEFAISDINEIGDSTGQRSFEVFNECCVRADRTHV